MRRAMGLVHIYCVALLASAVHWTAARSKPPAAPARKYVLIIFGDSLSDTGNTYRAAKVPDENYYWKGRFSDGPNWVDHLQKTLAKKHDVQVLNYAHGGATACATDPILFAPYPFVKNLTGQTAAFLADVKAGKVPSGKNVKLVPLQWIGSNDFLFPLLYSRLQNRVPSLTELTAALQALITCRLSVVLDLVTVPGIRDLTMLPVVPLHTSPLVPAEFKPLVKQLGANLAQAMEAAVSSLQDSLDKGGVKLKLHLLGDLASWIERASQTVKPPFKYVDEPCWFNYVGSLNRLPSNITVCSKPKDYLFYDEVHPGSRFQQWVADKGILPRMQQLRLLP